MLCSTIVFYQLIQTPPKSACPLDFLIHVNGTIKPWPVKQNHQESCFSSPCPHSLQLTQWHILVPLPEFTLCLSKPLLLYFDIQVTIIANVDLLTRLPLFILTSPEYILCISGISQRERINVQIRSHHCPSRALHGFLVQWNEVETAVYNIQDPMGPSSSTSSHTALIASAPPASFLPQGVCTCCFPCIACSSFSCLHG